MAAHSKGQILSLVSRHKVQIAEFGVERLGLFGSFVREEQGSDSDVDMLVEFKSGRKTFDSFMGLAFFVEEIFGRRVELVTRESLSPYIGPSILNETEYVDLDDRLSSSHSE